MFLVVPMWAAGAFLIPHQPLSTKHYLPGRTRASSALLMSLADSQNDAFGHSDILWKIRPPPGMSIWKRLWVRIAANLIRIFNPEPPLVLCPQGGQAVLEAHVRPSSSPRYEKIARFGITTERGPSNAEIRETVSDIYGIGKEYSVGVGAIIYMFVEPPFRKKNVGGLALQVVSLVQAAQGCDFTVLVADDDGSGKLLGWYEKNGFQRAPKLQDVLGSPNAIHGVTMIAPTKAILPAGCAIQWW